MAKRRSRIRGALKPAKLPARPQWSPAQPAPAPAPAAPPQPAPTPMPWDTRYETQIAGIDKNLGDTLSEITYQQGQASRQFGFDDTSNPYSNLANLRKQFEIGKRSALNSAASRGQLYSGAAQNAQNYATEDYNKGYQGLQDNYNDLLHQYTRQRTQAESQAAQAKSDAAYDRTMTALANRPDPDELDQPQPQPQQQQSQPNDPLASVRSQYEKAGYKIGSGGSNAKGPYIYVRQPNTGQLFRVYASGERAPR